MPAGAQSVGAEVGIFEHDSPVGSPLWAQHEPTLMAYENCLWPLSNAHLQKHPWLLRRSEHMQELTECQDRIQPPFNDLILPYVAIRAWLPMSGPFSNVMMKWRVLLWASIPSHGRLFMTS
ncbi:hypothetical protein VNO77_03555 [Canavalia gladiata]|uniref:Uncharacterized protein n=1 Tax=Canavalia gladiata TaxID=3824 RepID=A0AAN9R6Y1_CANGL